MRPLSRIPDLFLSFIFPMDCLSCGQRVERYADTPACRKCWEEARILTDNDLLCSRCGVYFGPRDTRDEVLCRKCDDHHYDEAFACGLYEKAIAAAVVGLKETPKIFPTLRREIRSAMQRPLASGADLIIPVPLSRQRMMERGFNQADLIADVCSRALSIPVDKASLMRTRDTARNRANMDAKARAASVEKAFAVVRPKLIEGKSILLVDDVLTSGATASNCAEALKKSGASSVTVFTLARAVLKDL